MKFVVASLALACVLAVRQGQDPPPPKAPEGAAPLPQVPDVAMTPVQRKDLWQRFVPPSPLAGTYQLKAAARGGQLATSSVQGWMMVSQRFLSIHIQDETGQPGKPSIQASVREYEYAGTQLTTTSRLGVRIASGENPVLEAPGLVETRLIQLTSTTLRVVQGGGDYLEFERVD